MTSTTCPGAEELARLIDGELGSEQRTTLLAHVASCPRCLEVIGGSVHALESTGLAGVVSPARIWQKRVLYAAAVLVVAAGIATVVLRSGRPSRETLAALPFASQLAAELPRGRGGPGPEAWSPAGGSYSIGVAAGKRQSTLEFRVGVRLLDLDVALRAHDRTAAGYAIADVVSFLSGLSASDELVGRYRVLERQLAGEALGATAASLGEAERHLVTQLQSPYLALGSWCESGRMSIELGRARAEWPDEARALLGALSEREVPPGVVISLRDIAEPGRDRFGLDETRRRASLAFTRILELM
jgi:hypothetical protein